MKAARLVLTIAIGAALIGVLASKFPTTRPPSAPVPDMAQDAQPRPEVAAAAAADAANPASGLRETTPPASASAQLPGSLAGAELDGGVNLDADGRLVPDLALRRLFDQLLTLVGERSLDEIRALLARQLDALTSAEGKRQALAAFERYLKYLGEVDAAGSQLSALPLRERLERLVELRRQHLGTEMADAFFGDEEAYQRYTLDRRELAEDTTVGAEERAARERELLAELPPAVREPLLAQQRVESDLADAQAIHTLASDADERHALRRERFGEEAAARMELLDRERAAWDTRLAAYRAERTRVERLDSAARTRALDEYLSRHFSEAEQRRIRSLQDVGAL